MIDVAGLVEFVMTALRTATPLVFAALAVLVAERAGVFHIGVEGVMLLGAFAGVLAAVLARAAWPGVLAGILIGLAAGAILAAATVTLPTDQVVMGLAFNIACVGVTSFAFRLTSAATQKMTPPLTVPLPDGLAAVPGARLALAVPPLAWLAAVLALVTWYVLFHTGAGLLLRATGHSSHAASAAGVDVRATRIIALVVAGALSGLAGAALTVGWVRSFTDNITLGRGFIALAAVYCGRWNPGWTVAACLLFGAGEALAFRAQGVGGNPHYYLVIPYALTLAVVARSGRARAPQEAGKPYLVP
jgi:general nucleoside transport system permease protein